MEVLKGNDREAKTGGDQEVENVTDDDQEAEVVKDVDALEVVIEGGLEGVPENVVDLEVVVEIVVAVRDEREDRLVVLVVARHHDFQVKEVYAEQFCLINVCLIFYIFFL